MRELDGPRETLPSWRRALSDDEFLCVRLLRTLDEVQGTISRLERVGDPASGPALAALARLREDLVAALRLAGDPSHPG